MTEVEYMEEPIVKAAIMTPTDYVGHYNGTLSKQERKLL